MISILIADDHAILRQGLKEILARRLPGTEFGEAKNAEEVLMQVRSLHWDLLILDLSMPGRSGLAVLADLNKEQPELPVLILSMHSEDQYGNRLLRAGASGYMNKESPPEDLIEAVRRVLAGGRYVSAALAEKLAGDLSEPGGRPLHENLSDREMEVLWMIASGRSVSQIADDLHLSVATVSTYRARLLEKMKMANNAELMRYAIRNGLIE